MPCPPPRPPFSRPARSSDRDRELDRSRSRKRSPPPPLPMPHKRDLPPRPQTAPPPQMPMQHLCFGGYPAPCAATHRRSRSSSQAPAPPPLKTRARSYSVAPPPQPVLPGPMPVRRRGQGRRRAEQGEHESQSGEQSQPRGAGQGQGQGRQADAAAERHVLSGALHCFFPRRSARRHRHPISASTCVPLARQYRYIPPALPNSPTYSSASHIPPRASPTKSPKIRTDTNPQIHIRPRIQPRTHPPLYLATSASSRTAQSVSDPGLGAALVHIQANNSDVVHGVRPLCLVHDFSDDAGSLGSIPSV
ncbi:hypothetical protein B0H17DRAFT_1197382 [Mycena rosella]|uniref:Uncharacterized protein n=1 Tax=Mycena rosella TaxID=1033263 RepID=A0AAD7DR21_MYCRO|nr:hypothetical protein B0H17DRAFT_1197382 [Mycena rosella]